MYLDLCQYLPDDILVKVDRATMAVGLESRIPLLDHRVVEFAWGVPPNLKCVNGETKWLLRQLLYRHVPQALIDRPKMGFGVPLAEWLRGPLRDWAESQVGEARLRREGFLDVKLIRRVWHEFLNGTVDHSARLWSILMFQAWLERWARGTARVN